MMRRVLAICLALLASLPVQAERASVQVNDDKDFGRIAIALEPGVVAGVHQHGNRIDVVLPTGTEVVTPNNVPRNVVSMVGGNGSARLTVLPGTRLRWSQGKRALILRIMDPSSHAPKSLALRANPGKPASPKPAQPAISSTITPAEPAIAAAHEEPVAAVAAAPEAPVAADQAEVEPVPASEPPHAADRAFTVDATADTGVASFRRTGLGVVVFDDPVTLADADSEPAALRPTIEPAQRGVVMTVPLADDEALTVTRSDGKLTVSIKAPTGSAAPTVAIPRGVQFQVAKPGRVMAVSDEASGQTMLVGTTRQTDGDHARVDTARAAPGYVLLQTWLGVAVETSSDEIDLRASATGYLLETADKAATNAVAAAPQQNQFSIPVAPAAVLMRQLNMQLAGAAAAAPRARGPDRVAAARTMLALGMSAEAEALLGLAAAEDPVVARDPNTAALTGVAAVLAGRPSEAAGLDDPALPTGGDIALWRGIRDADLGKPAPALAGAWPLLHAYPEAVLRHIAPKVLEAAAENGAEIPADDMQGASFALARALKLAHDGQIEPALEALADVANSRDERDSVRAAIAAAELRLRVGQYTPAQAADQLERQTVRWRGDAQELAVRLRIAALRRQAGQWRASLDGLRRAESLFPDASSKIAGLKVDVFRALLLNPAADIAPLEMVLIAGEFADSLPNGTEGDQVAGLLAEKLAALDLPSRAIPVLQKLVNSANSPVAKMEFALRLAQMHLDAGEPAKAAALLSSLDMDGIASTREEQRTMLLARAKAAQGDFSGAATILLTVATPEADEMRAGFYARAGDWQRSAETLESLVTASVPEAGDLDETQQDLVLRNVTAAVQAGDGAILRRLKRFERRITMPRADLFRVLTANAVTSPDDLPRAARELVVARSLPDRLNALKSR